MAPVTAASSSSCQPITSLGSSARIFRGALRPCRDRRSMRTLVDEAYARADRLFTSVGLADDLELRIEGRTSGGLPTTLGRRRSAAGPSRRSLFAPSRPDHSALGRLLRASCSTTGAVGPRRNSNSPKWDVRSPQISPPCCEERRFVQDRSRKSVVNDGEAVAFDLQRLFITGASMASAARSRSGAGSGRRRSSRPAASRARTDRSVTGAGPRRRART